MASSGETIFERFADRFGPAKIVHIQDQRCGLKGIVVIDNVARGPAIGGVRMAPDVDVEEVARLARAMTLKNAAAGLPHGGGKSAILADPHRVDKEPLLRAFARQIRDLIEYIPGPDMGTDERCMGYIQDEIGRCVGRPRALGGIPLDEIGATGYGLAQVARLALSHAGIDLVGATVAVQGFGSVGRHVAQHLVRLGCRLVAAADSTGTIYRAEGLDLAMLLRIKQQENSVLAYPQGVRLGREEVLGLACDLLIPAARPDAVTAADVDRVRTRVILEGANIPVTAEAEHLLHDRGILCIPDFIANAGGVICAAVEYAGGSEQQALAAIRQTLRRNTRDLLERIVAEKLYPREAALHLALRRVEEAMTFRR